MDGWVSAFVRRGRDPIGAARNCPRWPPNDLSPTGTALSPSHNSRRPLARQSSCLLQEIALNTDGAHRVSVSANLRKILSSQEFIVNGGLHAIAILRAATDQLTEDLTAVLIVWNHLGRIEILLPAIGAAGTA